MNLKEAFSQVQSLIEALSGLVHQLQFANKRFLCVKSSAGYCSLSEESIRRLLASGKLTALRPVKGKIVIDRKELDAYVLSCTKTPRTGRGRHSTK